MALALQVHCPRSMSKPDHPSPFEASKDSRVHRDSGFAPRREPAIYGVPAPALREAALLSRRPLAAVKSLIPPPVREALLLEGPAVTVTIETSEAA